METNVNVAPEIIERLKEEKVRMEDVYYVIGKNDGLSFAQAADYYELWFAACHYVTSMEFCHDSGVSYNPFQGELDDYFKEKFSAADHPNPYFDQLGDLDPHFVAWQQGWKDAVVEFWEQVKVLLKR